MSGAAVLVGLARGGMMQNVLNLSGDFEGELDLIESEARASGDRVLFSVTAGRSDASGTLFTDRIEEMRTAWRPERAGSQHV